MSKSLSLLIACGIVLVGATTVMAQATIPNDVAVTFSVCLEGTGTSGDVCVTGSNNELTNWGNGVVMTDEGGDFWDVTITFPAGTVAAVEYKYKSDGCATWEDGSNRMLQLPTDGTGLVVLPSDSFNRVEPIGCGLSGPLDNDVTICFQVCMDGVTSTGGQCVIGKQTELGEWGTGMAMRSIGANLYQRCVTFPAGRTVPVILEYKFQKDECATWEQLPGGDPFANRTFRLDNDTPATVTLTSVWENGEGTCATVAAPTSSWGTLKASFRD